MMRLTFCSRLAAPVDDVWRHASGLTGVNAELWPLRMSGGDKLRLSAQTPLGRPLFRSLLSLLGVVPVDLHTFVLEEVWPRRGFRERSRSLLQRTWMHQREVVAGEEGVGSVLTDLLEFEPRVLTTVTARVIHYVFVRRHRALRARFGEPAYLARGGT